MGHLCKQVEGGKHLIEKPVCSAKIELADILVDFVQIFYRFRVKGEIHQEMDFCRSAARSISCR